jgi:hypothetical protein
MGPPDTSTSDVEAGRDYPVGAYGYYPSDGFIATTAPFCRSYPMKRGMRAFGRHDRRASPILPLRYFSPDPQPHAPTPPAEGERFVFRRASKKACLDR